jgi:hypothetical protein
MHNVGVNAVAYCNIRAYNLTGRVRVTTESMASTAVNYVKNKSWPITFNFFLGRILRETQRYRILQFRFELGSPYSVADAFSLV